MATIYVIFHETFENTNVFTLDFSRVNTIIQEMETKYPDTNGEWKFIAIEENVEFEAVFN